MNGTPTEYADALALLMLVTSALEELTASMPIILSSTAPRRWIVLAVPLGAITAITWVVVRHIHYRDRPAQVIPRVQLLCQRRIIALPAIAGLRQRQPSDQMIRTSLYYATTMIIECNSLGSGSDDWVQLHIRFLLNDPHPFSSEGVLKAGMMLASEPPELVEAAHEDGQWRVELEFECPNYTQFPDQLSAIIYVASAEGFPSLGFEEDAAKRYARRRVQQIITSACAQRSISRA